ncbi:hypothetical protein [Phaeobacter sp. 11ANDIMAR09]|uniref:hypothetical protein n=1 Tax=Phaeobacter sp. 11ANDIMAR09 TaxID=1225647 RepID=UPI0006C8D9F3|nr:hypothetical protein [Phaeobacter sp. 11ANDIMAR09]KPD13559.1 hypothetical protein AN476_05045 [Phaeobacter sp. 11ANDIMAR09]
MSAAAPALCAAEWQALGFEPGPALRLFGMRRSGNHAITNWLQRNAPTGRSVFLNNCTPKTHPFKTFKSLELDAVQGPHRKAQKDLAGVAGPAGDGAMLLISYEDSSPAEFSGDKRLSGPFDDTLLTANLVAYRSFLNWSASLLKKMQPNEGYSLSRRTSILLRAFDTYTRILALVTRAQELGLTCILYDRWVTDAEYRASILAELGLPLRDNTLGEVQRYGGGSSFQKQATSVEELQTDQRGQQMLGDPEYQAVLHLAARDQTLMAALDALFPKDAAYLRSVATQVPMPSQGGAS